MTSQRLRKDFLISKPITVFFNSFPYFHLVKYFYGFLLFLLVLLSVRATAQDPLPRLTRQLAGCSDAHCIRKALGIAQKETARSPENVTAIRLWTFYVSDSLGAAGTSDSICRLITAQPPAQASELLARVYSSRGNALVDSSRFEEAIQSYYKGLKSAQTVKNKQLEGSLQRMIGLAYLKLSQHSKAENHLRSSLHIFEALKDDKGIANATISLGNALKEQGRIEEAVRYYEQSLRLAKKIGNQRLIAGNYNNLGNAMRRLNKKQQALNYFFKALEMNEKSGNKLWISFNYHNIGNTYNDLKEYAKAITYFEKSNAIKREIGDSLSLVTGYLSISESYAALHNYEQAYQYLQRHNKLKDTLNLIDQANALHELEAQYESAKKEAEINHLIMENQLRDLKAAGLRQRAEKIRNYLFLSGLAALFLAIGIVFLIRTNHTRKRANHLLNEKNNEVEASNSALQLALKELSIKNKEVIDSINYATYIQQAALPNISQQTSDLLRFELFFAPKDIVSGDFYFSYQLHQRSIFGVADCTGHGVPGAMVSLVGMNSLDKVVREEQHDSSSAMVTSLNSHVLNSLHRGGDAINDGMDIGFCFIEHATMTLHFTGANHNGFVLRKSNEEIPVPESSADSRHVLITLPGTRRPIGRSMTSQPFTESRFQLQKGDRIVLFSDGYADQTGALNGKKMKRAQMMKLLQESAGLDVAAQVQFMRDRFFEWKQDTEQVDDVCLLCVEVIR